MPRGGWRNKSAAKDNASPATLLNWNCQSLLAQNKLKLATLIEYAARHKPRAMCITETWLDKYIADAEIHIPGYVVLRADREQSAATAESGDRHDGVLWYIREELLTEQHKKIHRRMHRNVQLDGRSHKGATHRHVPHQRTT